jgi:MFS family permease
MARPSRIGFQHAYPWVIAVISHITVPFGYGTHYCFSVFYVPGIAHFGWDRTTGAVAYSINLLVCGLFAAPVGYLVDRYHPRRLIAWGGGALMRRNDLVQPGGRPIAILCQLWRCARPGDMFPRYCRSSEAGVHLVYKKNRHGPGFGLFRYRCGHGSSHSPLGGVGVSRTVCKFVGGALSDRFPRWIIYGLGAIIGGSGIGMPAAARVSHGVWILAAYAGLFGAGYEIIAPIFPALCADLFGGSNYGKIYALITVDMSIGAGFGPLLDGMMFDRFASYEQSLLVAIASFSLSAVCIAIASKGPKAMSKELP